MYTEALWIQEIKPLFNSIKILIIVFEFAMYLLELEIKKKNYFRPTYPILLYNVTGNTIFFFCMASCSIKIIENVHEVK
jgi:hypothetical protein